MKPILSDEEFERLRQFIYKLCGINLGPAKRELIIARLSKRMRDLGIETFTTYQNLVEQDRSGNELTYMLNAISTNKTDFFRESMHFDFLAEKIYPQLNQQQRIRIWSAACSTGEEPYTIAMTLLDALHQPFQKDIKILATDLSTRVLNKAEAGICPGQVIAPVPASYRQKYLQKLPGTEGHWQVVAPLRKLIHFRRLNLMERFPLTTQFDFIFCRNVMIYFDKPTQEQLVGKLVEFLAPGGHLFIGHSESLIGVSSGLKHVRSAIYQK